MKGFRLVRYVMFLHWTGGCLGATFLALGWERELLRRQTRPAAA